ncbi:MAG: pilC 1 [Verrucomicrobiales bacterium]|nr:pilC 1 [Verrucomicrobiales bacterium]
MNSRGAEEKGALDAEDQSTALARIKEMQLFPTRIIEDHANENSPNISGRDGVGPRNKGRGRVGSHSGNSRKLGLRMNVTIPGTRNRVSAKSLGTFTAELATLLQAGLPLLRGLRVLQKQERSVNLKRIIGELGSSIEGGSTLSEALAFHPKVFNRLFVNMVKAGELGGVLEVTLTRLSEFMEKAQKIRGKVIAAMCYPVAVMAVAVGIMALLLVMVVPKFKDVFEGLGNGRPLPAFTQFVLGLSDMVKSHFLSATIVVIGLLVALRLFTKTRIGRRILDRCKLNAPLFGPVLKKVAISRFTRTLGTLVSSGVPILQALNIVKETAGNVIVGNAVQAVHNSVKEGETITAPLDAANLFPPMVISMVDVGEQTGALPEMLMKIADKYDDEVDNAVAAMTSLLEPIMIVILGVIVGAIVIALYLPIIDIGGGIDPDQQHGGAVARND